MRPAGAPREKATYAVTMFWKIVAIVTFMAGVLVGAVFLQPHSPRPAPPAAEHPTTTIGCPPGATGPVDTSVI